MVLISDQETSYWAWNLLAAINCRQDSYKENCMHSQLSQTDTGQIVLPMLQLSAPLPSPHYTGCKTPFNAHICNKQHLEQELIGTLQVTAITHAVNLTKLVVCIDRQAVKLLSRLLNRMLTIPS